MAKIENFSSSNIKMPQEGKNLINKNQSGNFEYLNNEANQYKDFFKDKNNKSHDVPMVYIDETAINKIQEYIHAAGLIVDRTVGTPENIHTSEDTLSGVSSAGIKYTASINANGYSACFKLFRTSHTMTGILPTLYDSEYKNPAYRLFIEKEIDDLFWKEYMSRLAQEVTHESG